MSVGSPVEDQSIEQKNKGQRRCWGFEWQAGERGAHSGSPVGQPTMACGLAGPHF